MSTLDASRRAAGACVFAFILTCVDTGYIGGNFGISGSEQPEAPNKSVFDDPLDCSNYSGILNDGCRKFHQIGNEAVHSMTHGMR